MFLHHHPISTPIKTKEPFAVGVDGVLLAEGTSGIGLR